MPGCCTSGAKSCMRASSMRSRNCTATGSPSTSRRSAGHAARARHWQKAVEYARRAGLKTAARDANVESVRFYERALDYLQHWEDEAARRDMAIDLHLAIRDPLFRLGRITEIDDHLRQAEPLLRPLGDSVASGLLHVLDANALTLRGEYTQAFAACAKRCALPGRSATGARSAHAVPARESRDWCADEFVAADAPLRAAHEFLEAHPTETRYGLNRRCRCRGDVVCGARPGRRR